jgi:virginiamycin A acetyltransferase
MPDPGPDTRIGNDVWIGQGARILPGAQIGDGVIVGAGAVVSGHVPDYHIVGGTPARTLRARFDETTRARLKAIAWWNWPITRILAHEAAICGVDIDALEQAV